MVNLKFDNFTIQDNIFFKKYPEKLEIQRLYNFKYIFPSFRPKGSMHDIMYNLLETKLPKPKSNLNSQHRFGQTLNEFINEIYLITRSIGLNPGNRLSDENLLKIAIYILKETDYTYYDLVQ